MFAVAMLHLGDHLPTSLVSHLFNFYTCKIAHVELIPAREAKFGKPDHPLSESVTATLDRKGIRNLFCHQAEALNAVAAGALGLLAEPCPLLTKSLCCSVPIWTLL